MLSVYPRCTLTKLRFVLTIAILLIAFSIHAQDKFWSETTATPESISAKSIAKQGLNASYYNFNVSALKAVLEAQSRSEKIIEFPTVGDYKSMSFSVVQTQLLSDELAKKYPHIKTYKGHATTNPNIRIRLTTNSTNVEALILYENQKASFIRPIGKGNKSNYMSYSRYADFDFKTFSCLTNAASNSSNGNFSARALTENSKLRSLRIAISATGEYTQRWDDADATNGNAQEDAFNQIVNTINRVNAIFETDMGITFQLVSDTTIVFPDPNADPYTPTDVNALFNQTQNVFDTEIGTSNYDIGHLFHRDNEPQGAAFDLNTVCENGIKGMAYSAHSFEQTNGMDFESDFFDVDFVPHEIGHQLGANHTYSHVPESGNLQQVEPGSGSTIMGYAGITENNNVQLHSDAYFHVASIAQILSSLGSKSCGLSTSTANNVPTANAGNDYTIPAGTAYILTGEASDPESDILNFTWEQLDSNGSITSANFGPDNSSGAMARSLPPSSDHIRYIPKLERVLAGQLTQTNPRVGFDWETVSTVSRDLNFAFTVRDRNVSAGLNQSGLTATDEMRIRVNANAGPFRVSSQNTKNISYKTGDLIEVSWEVAGTTENGINTAAVDVYLSIDGGRNFNILLAENSPNDGSETVRIPENASGASSRIMVKAVDNIFYAVNDEPFGIDFITNTNCLSFNSGRLNLDVPDGNIDGTPGPALRHSILVNEEVDFEFLKLNLNLRHFDLPDLTIKLIHPNGSAEAIIWDRTCANIHRDITATFYDGNPQIECGSPTSGEFSPITPFSVFENLSTIGEWTIEIVDYVKAEEGRLFDWGLEFCKADVIRTSLPPEFDCGNIIYPNPNNGEFTIKVCDAALDIIRIKVFDIAGRLIYSKNFKSAFIFERRFSFQHLAEATYIVSVNIGTRKISKRIVIDR